MAQEVQIAVDRSRHVSGLWQGAPQATACYVLAHGAGAGMKHALMESVAGQLAELRIETLRYQFPYMDAGSRRPDPPRVCHAVVRAAVAEARRRTSAPLFAGGRSFGGRMTSQAQAESPLEDVVGLIFLAFPLHPAGKPSIDRAQHLSAVQVPMLFLQGTRDELAELSRLRAVVESLGPLATLVLFSEADHSYHVPARTGRKDADVLRDLTAGLAGWIATQEAHR